jgi:hypothetical protein
VSNHQICNLIVFPVFIFITVFTTAISTAACFGESKYEEMWIENNQARICFLSIGEFRKY